MIKTISLHWIDYVIFALIMVISGIIGIVLIAFKKKGSDASDLVNAKKSFGAIPVALSITASFLSAIAVLGPPVEIYFNGTMYCYIIISVTLVVFISNLIFVPVFYESGVNSSYEYLSQRFNRTQKLLASVVFVVQTVIYQGIVLYAPSLAISQVIGFPLWSSIITIGIVCSLYTSLGGIRAVIWTDVFQVAVMFIAIILPLVKGSIDFKGFSHIWNLSKTNGRIYFKNFSLDPTVTYSFWSVIIGGTYVWLTIYAINQALVQRVLSIKTLKEAKRAYWLSLLGFYYAAISSFLVGFVLYAEYGECNPLRMHNLISASDQILPYYIATKLGDTPGMVGLFIAGITSAGLSTISSGTNALVSVTMNDLLGLDKLSPVKNLYLSKFLGFFYGALTLLFAYISSFMGSILKAALGLSGMLSGPVLGVFALGMLVPQSNSKGTITGQIISTLVTVWIGTGKYFYPKTILQKYDMDTCLKDRFNTSLGLLGSPQPINEYVGMENLYNISYQYISLIGFLISFVIGLVVSLVTGGNKGAKINSQLLSKYVRPFGVDHHEFKNDKYKDEESNLRCLLDTFF